MTITGPEQSSWTIVIPVKGLAAAKSRMSADGSRGTGVLALAFFQDTVLAARACDRVSLVVVTTSDPLVGSWATDHGCAVVSDAGHPGINAAAAHAARHFAGESGIAVVVSDLPSATPAAMGLALDLAARYPVSFLADLDGTGTTMWMTARGGLAEPAFGPSSRAAHRIAGAADLVDRHGDLPGLRAVRRDVDTATDLAQARAMGVGPHTQAATRGDSPGPT